MDGLTPEDMREIVKNAAEQFRRDFARDMATCFGVGEKRRRRTFNRAVGLEIINWAMLLLNAYVIYSAVKHHHWIWINWLNLFVAPVLLVSVIRLRRVRSRMDKKWQEFNRGFLRQRDQILTANIQASGFHFDIEP